MVGNKNRTRQKLESELENLESENKGMEIAYLDKRRQILEELGQIDVEEAKAAVGEYYGNLVHVTSACSDGRVWHYIGFIDPDSIEENSFGFKRRVTYILTENGKVCGADYDDYRLVMVNADTRELFASGKTSYRDVNPRFHHEVEIRRITKEEAEEFVNSAYNERLLAYSNELKLENKKSISAINANFKDIKNKDYGEH